MTMSGLLQPHARYHGRLVESRLMKVRRMADLELAGKRVLIREDLNVPVANGVVTSDARIRAALPTLQQAMAAGAKVFVMSHLGRPQEGIYDDSSRWPRCKSGLLSCWANRWRCARTGSRGWTASPGS